MDDVFAQMALSKDESTGSWRLRFSAVALALVASATFLAGANPTAKAAPLGEADHVPDETIVLAEESPKPGSEVADDSTIDDGHGHDHALPDIADEDSTDGKDGTNKNNSDKDKGASKKPGNVKDSNKKKDDVPLPPPPAVPDGLPVEVDPLAGYQGQYICSPETKVGAAKLTALIRATYETSSDIWTPRDCNQGGRSEHKEGRALDWMINSAIPNQNAQAESFLNWLLATDENGNEFAMARRLGVMYIGWGDEIWESYTRQWTELKGCYNLQDDGYDTYCHRDHIHISLTWDGAAAQTSFWGGDPSPAPFCSASRTPSSTPLDPGEGLDFIAIAPKRILDTRAGKGTSQQACRLAARSSGGAGSPVVVKVARGKGVDAKAVAVRVTTMGSNSPGILSAIATGNFDTIVMNAKRESVSILPVASDGTIAFTTNSGSTHLTVDILGYFVDPNTADADAGRLLAQANQVVYDSAALAEPLAPGEKRSVDVGLAATADGPPAGVLMNLTVTGTQKSGSVIVRKVGEKSSPADPRIRYRKNSTVTEPVIAALDSEGRVLLINRGKAPIDVTLALQASAVRTPEIGALLIPVDPVEVRKRRSLLTDLVQVDRKTGETVSADTMTARARISASGATAAVLRVSAHATGKGGEVTFYSLGQPEIPSLVVPRKSRITGLIIVPLDSRGTIRRDVVGDIDVAAAVVAYLL